MAVVQSAGELTTVTSPWYPSARMGGGSVALYNGLFSDYAAIWRTQPNVRTVVGFLARNIAQLGLHSFDRVSDRERRRVTDGAVGSWLRKPTPGTKMTMFDWVEGLVSDLALFDNTLHVKVSDGDRVATLPLDPTKVEPRGGTWIQPDAYRVRTGTGYRDFDPDEIIHIHGYNPADRRIGVSPMETLRRILAEDMAAGQNREQMWQSGARIGGVIKRPQGATWSDTARERFKSDWQSRYTGNGPEVGGTPILEDGMEYQSAAWSAKESEYIAARKLTREEVAAAYWIQPAMIGILEHANFSNIKEQHKSMYQDTLGPILQKVEQALNLQLAPDLGLPTTAYFEFNLKEKLRGSFEEEAQSLQTATGAPHMTRNEARARQNLPPVDGGDLLVTPLNVLIGGQASATDAGSQNLASLPLVKSFTKAQDPGVVEQEAVHRQIFERFFARQQSAVMGRIGAADSPTLDAVWDGDRWDTELAVDLLAAAISAAQAAGDDVVEVFGGTWDVTEVDGLYEALEESSRGMAQQVNEWTADHLDDALSSDDPVEESRSVLANMVATRAGIYASSRANTVWNFGRGIAGKSAGVPSKRWRTTSSNPRPAHRRLNGQTVPIDGTFSNGQQWPGDPAGGADDVANCKCTFDLVNQEA